MLPACPHRATLRAVLARVRCGLAVTSFDSGPGALSTLDRTLAGAALLRLLRDVLGELGGLLSEEEMRVLNHQVDGEHRPVAKVVEELRLKKGLRAKP